MEGDPLGGHQDSVQRYSASLFIRFMQCTIQSHGRQAVLVHLLPRLLFLSRYFLLQYSHGQYTAGLIQLRPTFSCL